MVVLYPVKKEATGSVRLPRTLMSFNVALSAISMGAESPIGEAVARFPPSVARLRI